MSYVKCNRYIKWHINASGLKKYDWFLAHEEMFKSALHARFRAIQAGFEPGPPEEIIDLFYRSMPHNGTGRALWNPHGTYKKQVKALNKRGDTGVRQRQLGAIIAQVDKRAKEARDADSDCSANGGGEELGRGSDRSGEVQAGVSGE